ncbi:hypothetical protein [Methylobacterium phyllosphaerae]|uniref:hypothetical protein n=1 Tax=Methylobacterium phyllosphaerae TaxID=418223 RepID=UPI00094CEE83|nr:hypothetical protein [Methylobacterium phyllosphaerae]
MRRRARAERRRGGRRDPERVTIAPARVDVLAAELRETDPRNVSRQAPKARSTPAPKSAAAPLTGDLGRFSRPGPDYSLTMTGGVDRVDRAADDRFAAARAS